MLGFALVCCEMNELFDEVAVILYFLQQSRQNYVEKRHHIDHMKASL
jgi:hypothetical protein